MAARKSCTKMTWAEAKNKCGQGGSKNPNKASLKIAQQPNHGKMLAAKILAKAGPNEDERVKNRQAAKMARKDQQRQEQLDRQRELEKEKRKLDEMVSPHETAVIKRKELEDKFHQKLIDSGSFESNVDMDDADKVALVCESKQLQLDEVLALEAIYADMDVLRMSSSSELERFQEALDEWQSDPDDTNAQASVANHPPLSYTLARSIDDPEDDDWLAHLLIHVRYSGDYPLETTPPHIEILWCMATKKSLVVSANKPLESLAILDEEGLSKAMSNEATENLSGMPVVYELMDTWLGEHLFDFLQKR